VSSVVGATVQFLAVAVFLLAGAQKLAAPATFGETLRKLRLPGVAVLRRAVPLLELATAALLAAAFRPAAAVLVALEGFGFGVAGIIALRRRTHISCACFGPLDSGVLGIRQVILVPVWLLVAASTLVLPAIGGLAGVAALTAIALAMGCVAAVYLMVPWVRDRRAAMVVTTR